MSIKLANIVVLENADYVPDEPLQNVWPNGGVEYTLVLTEHDVVATLLEQNNLFSTP